MLIEAKARDSKPAETRESRFNFAAAEKRTRFPVWIALALSGAFAYFRGFGGDAQSHAAEDGAVAPGTASHHRHPNSPSAALNAAPIELNSQPSSTPPETPPSSYWDDSTILLDDQLVSFETRPHAPTLHFDTSFNISPALMPGNDNRARVSNGAPIAPIAWHDRGAGELPLDTANLQLRSNAAGAASAGNGTNTGNVETNSSANQPNRSPAVRGPVRLNNVFAGQAMLLTLGDLLLGAGDADGDELHVTNLHASTGQILQIGGTWAYSANALTEGPVTLSYDVSDGTASVHQTALFSIVVEQPTASPSYVGTPDADEIVASDGNDVVSAGQGADEVWGNAGDDQIDGGDGNDILAGGPGDDTIYGGMGNDSISGGEGNDELHGGEGDDSIAGDDGNDVIFGDTGDDVLDGGAGSDLVQGGGGNDRVVDGAGDDSIDGGDGDDTLDLSGSTAPVTVDLEAGRVTGDDVGNDTIAGIEFVVGGSGNDVFLIGDDAICVTGGPGDDLYDVVNVPLPADGSISNAPGRYLEIVDFAVGDQLKVGLYDIWERPSEDSGPKFDGVYFGTDADPGPPIIARDDPRGDVDMTVVEADMDRDDNYEIVITLRGHHDLAIAHHPIA